MQFQPWMHLARSQAGVISRGQLLQSGLTPKQVDGFIAGGALLSVGGGVLRVAAAPFCADGRLWTAALSTSGTLAGAWAAHLWQLIDEPLGDVEVIVPRERRVVRRPGVRVIRRDLGPDQVTTRYRLPVTTRTISALDYLAGCSRATATAFADRAISKGWLSRADLQRRLEKPQLGNPIVRGVLRTLVTGAEAESERRLHRLLRDAGITGWSPNHRVMVGGRVVARIDVAFPSCRLAIEVDGFAYHSDHQRFEYDRIRQNDLVSLGWTVLRFTWQQIVENPEQVVAIIVAHLRRVEDLPPVG